MIAVVLALAGVIGPFMAGIVAALPIRVWATLLLGGAGESLDFVSGMLRGIIPSSFGALFFMLVLSRFTVRHGVARSFALASVVCTVVTVLGVALS